MKATFLKGVALGSAVSLATLAATAAFAGTGVGKVFNLGETNRVNSRSQLEGATPSAVLNVTNSDKSATASGVSIDVPGSSPPLVVNSATKVKNLNADLLDGHDASTFQSATSQSCAHGSAIGAISPNGAATCTTSAVFPIDAHQAPGGVLAFAYLPSSLVLHYSCTPQVADVDFENFGSAPATLSFNFTQDAKGSVPSVGNLELVSNFAFSASASVEYVGQFIYVDQTTVATVNISVVNGGMDGCEEHGTVAVAARPPGS